MSRMILLTEGMSNPAEAKTATGLLRYRGEEVVAVYDSACAGTTAGEVLGVVGPNGGGKTTLCRLVARAAARGRADVGA